MTAQQLRITRARYRVTQAALAEATGIPQAHLSRVENALATLSPAHRERIAAFFAALKPPRKETAIHG